MARLPLPAAARALLLALLAGTLLIVGSAPAGAAAPVDDRVDAAAVAAFFDAEVPTVLERHDVPGATVSVVHDGGVVFAGGYGLADVEGGVPFDPDTSMVRIASISKLFTWTAVMQLVEDGALDLDRDVNAYLRSFQVPDTYPEPVTLDHLMTHTAGFEHAGIGLAARDKDDVPPLAEHLAEHLPARIRPPGEISAYSNHGAALAGHIVAEVSGEPYEQYIEHHILRPLGMGHTTASEPVPAHLTGRLARSYEQVDGVQRPVPFIFDILVPDGSISASAADMARFMIAHLRGGRYAGNRILDASTVGLMHQQSYTAAPGISGWAHGFKERVLGDRRVIMHDGSWEQFQSAMVLVPDADVGVFVSFNGAGGIAAMGDLLPAFFDRVLPAPEITEITETTPSMTARAGGQIDGFYRATFEAQTTIEKLVTLVDSSRATVDADGTVSFAGRQWSAIGPDLYREVEGTERLAVIRGDDGAPTYLATDGPAYRRLARHETMPFNLVVMAVFLVPALTVAAGWPLAALVRRLRKRPAPARPGSWRTARRLAAVASITGLCFIVALILVLGLDDAAFLYGVPLYFRALMLVPVAFIGLAVATVVTTVHALRTTRIGLPARLHQALVVAGLVALTWFLQQWNLIGWQFN